MMNRMSADASAVSINAPITPRTVMVRSSMPTSNAYTQASTPASVGVTQPLAIPRRITTGASSASVADHSVASNFRAEKRVGAGAGVQPSRI